MSGHLRIADADRDRAAAELGEHYAVGRLSREEYDERLDAIWTARTRADLDLVFHDLPAQAPPAPAPLVRHPRPRGRFLPVLLVVLLVAVLVEPFWLVVAAGAIAFAITRRSRHRRRGMGQLHPMWGCGSQQGWHQRQSA